LGPIRTDRFFNRTFQVQNYGAEQLNVRIEINLDQHGWEAHQGSAGSVAAVAPNAAYWVDVPSAAMTVVAGSGQVVSIILPSPWVRMVATPTLASTSCSGFGHFLSL
jgi:hypothetical protein